METTESTTDNPCIDNSEEKCETNTEDNTYYTCGCCGVKILKQLKLDPLKNTSSFEKYKLTDVYKAIHAILLETEMTENDIVRLYDNENIKEHYRQLFECRHILSACKMLSYREGYTHDTSIISHKPMILSHKMDEMFKGMYNSIKFSRVLELSEKNRYRISRLDGDCFHKITCDITDTPVKAILYLEMKFPKSIEKRKAFFQGESLGDDSFLDEKNITIYIPIKTIDKFHIKNDKYTFSFYDYPGILNPYYDLSMEIIYAQNAFKIYSGDMYRHKIKIERIYLPTDFRNKIHGEIGQIMDIIGV